MNKPETVLSIKNIRRRIESNTADIDDYNAYANIIDQNGKHSHLEMQFQFKKYGFSGWQDFMENRNISRLPSGGNPMLGNVLSWSWSFLDKNYLENHIS